MDAYIYQADIYCKDCANEIRKIKSLGENSEDYPQGPFPDGGGEADSPQHCGDCGLFLENPLTEDGQDYVKEEVGRLNQLLHSEGLVDAVPLNNIHKWESFYSYLFDY